MSPKDVTVLQPVDNEPTFQSPIGQPARSPAHPSNPPPSSSSAQISRFVTSEQLSAIADKWSEQFARMEALFSRGNVFSTLVSSVKPVDTQHLISDTPFLAPATSPTRPVQVLVAVDASAHQSVLFKGDNSQPSSGPEKSATGSLFKSTSTVSQPDQDQAGACAYPPATEADPDL